MGYVGLRQTKQVPLPLLLWQHNMGPFWHLSRSLVAQWTGAASATRACDNFTLI